MLNKYLLLTLLILLGGVFIPHTAGLLCMEMTPNKYLFISYFYYSVLNLILLIGNSKILQHVGNKFNWTEQPIRKLSTLLLSYMLFTGIMTLIFTVSWYKFIVQIDISWPYVINFILIMIITVLFISHVHETKELIVNTIKEKRHTDEIEFTMVKNELNNLKSQIDPHFIFNSLNTLGFLIETDKDKASTFNHNLAELYQYVLSSRNKGLAFLKQEIEIAQKYFHLMRLRFGDDIILNIHPNVIDYYNYIIPSISLQILIENAIKHNKFNSEDNLIIHIRVSNDELVVSNKINEIANQRTTTGIGLENLIKRYSLLSQKRIVYEVVDGWFYVKIPLLISNNHEYINS